MAGIELNSQDPLILWNAIKANHTIVKQDSDQLTLFAAYAAYNDIKMRNDLLVISTVSWWTFQSGVRCVSHYKRSGKPCQPSEIPTKEAAFGGSNVLFLG